MSHAIPSHVGWEEIEDRVVVVDLRSGDFRVFAQAERDIWRGLARGASPAAIGAELAATYAVATEAVGADVDAFVAALVRADLIVGG
jgi:hypothetical protein